MSENHMYRDSVASLNAFKGCGFLCSYCSVSFQRQAKRQKPTVDKNGKQRGCQQCYDFEPHFHPERLKGKTPATLEGQFIFYPSSGDLAFAGYKTVQQLLFYARQNPQTKFLMQTKSPRFLNQHTPLPENVLAGITFETDQAEFTTPSSIRNYSEISNAPPPRFRSAEFIYLQHKHKAVTVEPVLQFDLSVMFFALRMINPEVVYVGYVNDGAEGHKLRLPEPRLEETLRLINCLTNYGINVRLKSLRSAWYEPKAEVKELYQEVCVCGWKSKPSPYMPFGPGGTLDCPECRKAKRSSEIRLEGQYGSVGVVKTLVAKKTETTER